MKFCWSTLRVNNMDESLKFYKDIVGLEMNQKFQAGPGTQIAFLGDGETQIELICDENAKEVNVGEDISWGFEVGSVDEMIKLVQEKGIDIHSGPIQPNSKVKFFFILDPNGLKIQFLEHL